MEELETDEEGNITVQLREELRAVSLAIVQHASRSLDIVSRHLDPDIYDREDFVEALKTLVLGSRYARVRLLILDSEPLRGRGHRLLALAERLNSYIEVRVPAPEHRDFNQAMLVADNQAYVQRQFSDRFEGTANYDDPRGAKDLVNQFEALWNRAVPDPNFRRLHV